MVLMNKHDVIKALRAKAASTEFPAEAKLLSDKADELEAKWKDKLDVGAAILAADVPWAARTTSDEDISAWIEDAFAGNDIDYEMLFGGGD